MKEIGPISPQDKSILQNLSHQETAGEEAFAAYYEGDASKGDDISQILQQSLSDANGIENPELHKKINHLLTTLDHTINQYFKHPTNQKLYSIASNLEEYKKTINENN